MTWKHSRTYSRGFIPAVITLLILSVSLVALAQTSAGPQSARISTNWIPQNPPVHFAKAVAYPSGGDWVYSVAVGDVNGDGHPDVVVANLCGFYNCDSPFWEPPGIGQIGVLLGTGDGMFQPTIVYNSGGFDSYAVSIGDVNGDGDPDLVVANLCDTSDCNNGSVSVLLGNGDGIFQAPLSYSSGDHAWEIAVGDVNGDGNPDLVVGTCSLNSVALCTVGTVGVLLGNGDGTFQTLATYSAGGSHVASVVIGDLNGDGCPDLVVANGGVGVLLNNGNGTFRDVVTYSSGGFDPESVAIADVDGDGGPDLLVANCGANGACGSGMVGVLLGNGNGTFQPPMSYSSGAFTGSSIAVGDVNGDNHLDLAVAGGSGPNGYVSVLIGNGDATFRSPVTYSSGSNNGPGDSIVIADLNGEGRPDLLVGNWGSNLVSVLLNDFTAVTSTKVTSSPNPSLITQPVTFTATVTATSSVPDGQVVTFYAGTAAIGTGSTKGGMASVTASSLSAGNHTIKAIYSRDPFHKGSSGSIAQVVNRYPTSTTLTSSLNPSIYGQMITWTARVSTSGTIPPTGTVFFTWQAYSIGSATLNSSGVATLSSPYLNADPYQLAAVYYGDANSLGSTSPLLNQSVLQTTSAATITSSVNPSKVGQAVTFTSKITSPTVIPKGPVTFMAGTTVLGTAQLSIGKAIFKTSTLPAGSNAVKVTYNGNSNIAGSSAVVTQVVH